MVCYIVIYNGEYILLLSKIMRKTLIFLDDYIFFYLIICAEV